MFSFFFFFFFLFSFYGLGPLTCPNSELTSVTTIPSTRESVYQHRTAQYRRTGTNIRALNGIGTQDSSVPVVQDRTHCCRRMVSLKIISERLLISQCVKTWFPAHGYFGLSPPTQCGYVNRRDTVNSAEMLINNLKHDTEMCLPMWWRHMAEVQTGTSLVARQPIKATDHHLLRVTYGPTEEQCNLSI
jgi:hypothetical protein